MNNFTDSFTENSATASHAALPAGVEQVRAKLSKWFQALQLTRAAARRLRFTARGGRAGVQVQLDVLSPEVAGDSRQRQLFHLEAQAAARLSHVNIVRTSKPQELDGLHFCVIEYKPQACTLRDLLSRNGWLAMEKACDIAGQVAAALDCAHALGVLHLQLSPDCILIEPNGKATVAGFGIEAAPQLAWAQQERARRLAATYASVEQARGTTCTAASDLYSLGAIFYETLTDRVPFDSDDSDYVRERQLRFTPAPPHLISPEVPEALSNVVLKLLEREARNRYDSAAAFRAALDGALRSNDGRSVDVP